MELRNNKKITRKIIAGVMVALMLLINPLLPALASTKGKAPAGRMKRPVKLTAPATGARERANKAKAIKTAVVVPQHPSDLELWSVRLFPEPLIAMTGKVVPGENDALAKALRQFIAKNNPEDISPLTAFIAAYPQSRWRASLELNLGLHRFDTGYLSEALSFWRSAWKNSRAEIASPQTEVAERAISELLQLDARLGRTEELKTLLAELGKRELHGSSAERLDAAQQGLFTMNHSPQTAYKCGPYAVNSLLCLKHGTSGMDPRIKKMASSSCGTNLKQVNDLAKEVGLNYQMAKRKAGAPFLIPCVMHWKVGHFAAIVAQHGAHFTAKDPTFDSNGTIGLTTQALEQESDGYFLVPAGALPSGWQPVAEAEAKAVWGKGVSTAVDESKITSNPKESMGLSCPIGMAVASAWSAQAELNIVDTPLSYTPMFGPRMDFRVNYSQNEGNQPASFTYSNLTADWSLNWISRLSFNSSTGNATILVRGGGYEIYDNSGGSPPVYTHNLYSNALLVYISSGVFQRQLPDGSIEVFNLSDGAGHFFMTEVIDPQGNAVTINYDTTYFRVTSVADANGHNTIFSYVSNTYGTSAYYLIASLTDAFGASVNFTYDSTNSYLLAITDAVGNVSQFAYQGSLINMMTTPYGTTSFYSYIPPNNATYQPRGLRFVFPDGSAAALENWLGEPKQTCYWDREATALYPTDPANQIYTHCKTTRWLFQTSTSAEVPVPNFIKMPLEAKRTYSYTGETGQDVIGTSSNPIEIQRVVTGSWMVNGALRGTVAAGDVVTIQISDPALPGYQNASYTVKAGDSLSSLATGLAQVINNNMPLAYNGITATATGTVVHISSTSTNSPSIAFSASGSGGEYMTFTTNSNLLETATLGGTVTSGDTLTLTMHDSALPGGQESVTCTVVAGDTLGTIAARLLAAVNADTNLQAVPVNATAAGDTIDLQSLSTNHTTYTATTSAGASESITLAAAASANTMQSWQFEYNSWGNVTQAIDPIGRTVVFTYASNGIDVLEATASEGSTNYILGEWTYNSQHEPLTYIDGSGQQTTYTYNVFGQLTSKTDALSNTTTYVYTGTASATIGGTAATGDVDTITVVDTGLSGGQEPVSYTVATGDTLSSIASNLASNINADSALQAIGVSAVANGTIITLTSTSPNGTSYQESVTGTETITLSTVDNGYLTAIYGPLSGNQDVTTLSFNPTGTLSSVTNSEGYTRSFTWDNLNRLLKTTYQDGTSEQNVYQNLDRIFSIDRLGRTTQSGYTSMDQLAYTIDPLGRKTQYQWCACGALATLTDPLGNQTQWMHDLEGRITAQIYPDSTSKSCVYESNNSRAHSITDQAGQVSVFAYNLDNTIQSKSYSNAAFPTSNVTLSYDQYFPRLVGAQNGWGSYSYSYNNYITNTGDPTTGGGMLSAVTNSVIANSGESFTYDAIGRQTAQAINTSANTTSWQYDAMWRLTSEVNPMGTFGYSYIDDTPGASKGTTLLASVLFPNSQVSNFSYYGNTGDERLKQITSLNAGGSVMAQFNYGYDAAGQIKQWMQQNASMSPVLYQGRYDLAGQLVNFAGSFGGAQPLSASQQFYSYDKASNRTGIQRLAIEPAGIGGTPTAGDTLTITVTNSALSGGQEPVSYTVQSGDTLSTIASQLAAGISADANLQGIGVNAVASGTTIYIRSCSSGSTTYAQSVSNSATETISLGVASNVKENASLSGSVTVSDVLTITVHDAGLTGGSEPVSYTVASGDSLASIATGLAAAINADTNLQAIGVSAAARSSLVTIASTSANITTYTQSTNSGATEAIDLSTNLNSIHTAAIAGTATASDTITLTVNDAGLTGGTESAAYTVQSGDTLSAIAAGLAAAVNADTNLQAIGVTASASNAVITLASSSVNISSYLFSKSSGASEAVIAGLPNNGIQTLAIAGAITAGDVLTVTAYDAGLSGGAEAASYTVASGDTPASIALGIAAAINADSNLSAAGITAGSISSVVNITSTSVNSTSYNASSSSGATETMALGLTSGLSQSAYNNVNELVNVSAGGPARFRGTTSKPMQSVTVASPVVSIAAATAPAATTYSSSTTGTLAMWLDMPQATNGSTTATVNGSAISAGAVVAITVNNASLSGGQDTQSYTVQSSDTFATVATALASAINGDSNLASIGVSATTNGAVISLTASPPSYSVATSGGATETATFGFNNSGNTTMAIGGTATPGDVLTLTTNYALLSGGTTSVSYTVQSGDTLVKVAAGLTAAINASTALSSIGITAASSTNATLTALSFYASQPLSAGAGQATISGLDGNNVSVSNGYQIANVGNSSTNTNSDLNGNLTSDGTNSYQFDAENRLAQTNYPGSGNNTQITYDGLGQPVEIVETTSGTVTSTKQFVWCNNQMCEERDATGAVTKRFFAWGEQIGGTNYFYVRDHLGNIRQMVDTSGNVVAQYDYTPWGERIVILETVPCDFGYAGMYYHPRSGLNLTMFRAYSSQLGRWLSRDPMGESAGLNLYGYVGNNPISGIDPLGLDTLVILNGRVSPGTAGGFSNPLGHAAIAVPGSGLYSYGTANLGSSVTSYVQAQAARRNSVLFFIKTSPAQEAAILNYLKGQSPNINPVDNCSHRVEGALKAGNIPLQLDSPNISAPESLYNALENLVDQGQATQFVIQKNSTVPTPLNLIQFNRQ